MAPPLLRMRHWSCPDDLLLESATASPLSGASRPWELEDLVSLTAAVGLTSPPARPSRWEERVLQLRESRGERRRRRLALVAAAAAQLQRSAASKVYDDNASDNNNIEDITEGKIK